MVKWIPPLELAGNKVILKPLITSHEAGIKLAANDGKLWELWFTSVPTSAETANYIQEALEEFHSNNALPFVVIAKEEDKIIGSTRYMNLDPATKRLEIGHTWYAQSYQRTGVNKECKYLLLKYAFEELQCVAVEFRTHFHNQASRTAITKLGAKQDGILRNHKLDRLGKMRDTVVFSITDEEWPKVKESLESEMNYYRTKLMQKNIS